MTNINYSNKALPFLIILLIIFACNSKQSNTDATSATANIDTIFIRDTIIISNDRDWQHGFGLTHEPDHDTIWFKPVSYYLEDKRCSGLAMAFYYGRLEPTDDIVTDKLLELASNDNHKLRPFYRWCLNKTILIQDGALAEHTGVPARKYAEKFPKEFLEYMDIDTSGQKYNAWLGSIEYSGFYNTDDFRKPQDIQKHMAETMKSNCRNCDKKTIKRIDKFTKACFD